MSRKYEDQIEFVPERFKIITDDSAHNLFIDPVYHPIIQALRNKYLTISELEKEYNRIIKEDSEKMFSKPEDKRKYVESNSRKGQTLYRYVSHLREKNLVAIGGTRIRMGQIVKEILYCTTAKSFLYKHDLEKMWSEPSFREVIKRIKTTLEKKENIPEINEKILSKFIIKINQHKEDNLQKIIETLAENDLNVFDGLNLIQIGYFTEILNYLFFMMNPDVYSNELKKIIPH